MRDTNRPLNRSSKFKVENLVTALREIKTVNRLQSFPFTELKWLFLSLNEFMIIKTLARYSHHSMKKLAPILFLSRFSKSNFICF